MSAPRRVLPEARRRGWCPSLARPMPTGDGLLARVHPPLGRLSPGQLRTVARGGRLFGNGHVDVTTRANLQIRGVTESSITPLAAMLDAAGLGDRRADGGPQRLTLTSPLAGLDPAEPFDVLALADAIETAARDIPELPPKTLVAIEGLGVDGEGADLVLRPEAGGRVAIRLAGAGDALAVPAIAAAATVAALLRAFVATGRRRMRDLAAVERDAVFRAGRDSARAHSPPPSAGEGGPRVSEGRERGAPCPDAALPSPACSAGTLPRKGGREGGVAVDGAFRPSLLPLAGLTVLAVEAPFGRCTAQGLERLADTAEALGCAEIRVSPSRGFVLACTDHETIASGLAALAVAGFVTAPDDPRRAVAACPGAPACASGSTPVPGDAARLARAFAPFAARGLRAHVSGCAKGCAHPAPASLTLVGEGGLYRVVLGGAPGEAGGPLEAFESVLERVSTADPTHPLDQAFRP